MLDQLSPVEQSYIAGVLVEKAIVSSWDIEVGLRYIRYYSLREEKLSSYSGVKKNLYSDPPNYEPQRLARESLSMASS